MVYQLLQDGQAAPSIIEHITDVGRDSNARSRQYGVITFGDGSLRIAAFTGSSIPTWAGDMQDIGFGVTVQGNTLADEEVVSAAMEAFIGRGDEDRTLMSDRLMRALAAGSAAGGDRRCNTGQVIQSAASAAIFVSRGGDEPYAARNIDMTDSGTPDAPWLAISVVETQFGPNPVLELNERYDMWRRTVTAVDPNGKLAATWGAIRNSAR